MREMQEGDAKTVTEANVWSGGDGIAGDRGVFGISVAAELAGVPVQTLRLFEARGLLEPSRTDGGTRRYSSDDVGRARHITTLQDEGMNLAGIAAVLTLHDRIDALTAENAALHDELTRLRRSMPTRATTEQPGPGRRRRRTGNK